MGEHITNNLVKHRSESDTSVSSFGCALCEVAVSLVVYLMLFRAVPLCV
jgi:hypothetical protein